MNSLSLKDIEEARKRIEPYIRVTPLKVADYLSRDLKSDIFLKSEYLQLSGSFKVRGAINKILQLTEKEKKQGVIAASAGNHAQGVAYSSHLLGVPATIVMPIGTPLIKVENTRYWGPEVILFGENYDEAFSHASKLAEERGLIKVHAYDDPMVMAGQGTVGLEILDELPDVDMVVVPVGGGGLISGIACAIKENHPEVTLIGVQASESAALYHSFKKGEIVNLTRTKTFAEGIRVGKPGVLTFPIIQKYVDEMVTVEDDEIAEAVLVLMEQSKAVVEGAGAAPLAAVIEGKIPVLGQKVVLVLGGGNIDLNLISRIIERGLVQSGKKIRIRLRLLDKPGSLALVSRVLADLDANIISVSHERSFDRFIALSDTSIEFTLETRGHEHVEKILTGLKNAGYQVKVI